MKISKEDALGDFYRFQSQRSTMILNSNKLQSPLGAQDCYPEVNYHIYLTNMVIKCGLNSNPYHYLPFIIHTSPRNRNKIINSSLFQKSFSDQNKVYSPCMPRKSRPILPIKKLNKLNYFQQLANRLHNPIIFEQYYLFIRFIQEGLKHVHFLYQIENYCLTKRKKVQVPIPDR